MSGLALLCGKSEAVPLLVDGVEIFRDSEVLLDWMRRRPGEIAWLAIAADVSDAEAVAERVRALDPHVSVVLAGAGRAPESLLPVAAGEPDRRAMVAELATGIAHDVGTPLTTILGYADLLAGSAHDDKNRGRARRIVEQVHRLRDLIDTLTEMSSVPTTSARSVDLAATLEQAIESFRPRLEHAGVEVDWRSEVTPPVLGDAGRLQRALRSVLRKAIESSRAGTTISVSLTSSAATGAESDSDQESAGGIAERELEIRISNPGGRSLSGLDLLVARMVVEDHGGTLSRADDPDDAAEFRLAFPAASASGSASTSVSPSHDLDEP